MKPPPQDSQHEKWCGWLKDIEADLTDLFLGREVWRTLNRIVDDNPRIPYSHFFEFEARNYASTQASAVRRQSENGRGRRVVSLGSLLKEIAESPQKVSRQRCVSMYPWGRQWEGDEKFDRFCAPGDLTVDPAIVQRDFDQLQARGRTIKEYVDKHIAHYERSGPTKVRPTFTDLDDAIDCLGEVFLRYNGLLTGEDKREILPVPIYDWLKVFRIPWIPEDGCSTQRSDH